MQQPPDPTQFPAGVTVVAKVEWQTLVPVMTSLRLLAPEVSGTHLPCFVAALAGDSSEQVTFKVFHLGEALRKGVQFEVCRPDLTVIGQGIVQGNPS